MQDIFSFPEFQGADIKIYNVQENLAGTDVRLRIWTKPIGKTMGTFIMYGGGGGGGGGCGGAGGAGKGGGGGGGSSGYAVYQIPLILLPDRLVMVPGTGGAGGAGGSSGNGTVGSNGVDSRIVVYGVLNAGFNYYFAAGNGTGGTGGGAGTNAAGGAGGAAGVVAGTGIPLYRWAIASFQPGLAGSAGGFAAVGADVTPSTAAMPVLSGSGGAGCTTTTFAGGNILAVANTPWSQSNGGAAETAGSCGFGWNNKSLSGLMPDYVVGGTGGGSSNTITGGAGGSCGVNAPGAGGGGGGGGVTIGGAGGRGGDGRIIVICQ